MFDHLESKAISALSSWRVWIACAVMVCGAAGVSGETSPRSVEMGSDKIMPITKRSIEDRHKLLKTCERLTASSFPKRDDLPTQVSLLSYLDYIPAQREQGECGACWLWASTGCAAMDLNLNKSVKDRLSIQFAMSYSPFVVNLNCCDGGNPQIFLDLYNRIGYFIPWSNANASFDPTVLYPTIYPNMIGTDKRYYLQTVTAALLDLGDDQQTAITTIKTALANNNPVYFGFHMNKEGWTDFTDYWHSYDDSPWTFKSADGKSYIDNVTYSGGHATILVGYDDPKADGSGYWTVLNSWGVGADSTNPDGYRPDGTFTVSMDIDYQAESPKWGKYRCIDDDAQAFNLHVYTFAWNEDVKEPQTGEDSVSFSNSFNDNNGSITIETANLAWIIEDDTPDTALIRLNTYPQTVIECDDENGRWRKTGKGHSYKSDGDADMRVTLNLGATKDGGSFWKLKLKSSQLKNALNPFNGFGAQLDLHHNGNYKVYSSPYVLYDDFSKTNVKMDQKEKNSR